MYNLKDQNCIQIVSDFPLIEFCLHNKSSQIMNNFNNKEMINQKYSEDYD